VGAAVWNHERGDERNTYKGDDSLKSFIFTLKNPHNTPARKFAMNAERRQFAIVCDSSWGPFFGTGFCVCDNANSNSQTYPTASVQTNDTGLDGTTFFTGSANFTVREIKVFKISD
jgi:hypothetical protein